MGWRHGDSGKSLTDYAHPEVLVNAAWLADRLDDPQVWICLLYTSEAADELT
mgnify:CR=1 FL=1